MSDSTYDIGQLILAVNGASYAAQSAAVAAQAAATAAEAVYNVSIGTATFVQNFLITTATTTDQLVASYTVPAGHSFYLSYAEIEGFYSSWTSAVNNYGVAHLSINGAHIHASRIAGQGTDKTSITLSPSAKFASGTVIEWFVTPASTTSTEWYGNLAGYVV